MGIKYREINVLLLLLVIFWAPINQGDGKKIFVEASGSGFFSAAKISVEESDIAALLKWERLGPRMESLVDKVLDTVWPSFNNTAKKINLSLECKYSVDKLLRDLKDLRMWAIKMVDSSGFHTGGRFFDNWSSYGEYDRCLELQIPEGGKGNTSIQGQYCLVDFQPPIPPRWRTYLRPKTIPALDSLHSKYELVQELQSFGWEFYNRGFRFGICLPSSCHSDEIDKMANTVANHIGFQANVQSCEISQPKKIEGYHVVIIDTFLWLYVNEHDITRRIILSMVVLTGILCSFMETDVTERTFDDGSLTKKVELSFPSRIINAFSAYRNTVKALSIDETPDTSTAFINGIKCITMFWVIAIHMLIVAFQAKIMRGHGQMKERNGSFYIQIFTNGQVTVDIFFFLTGFLLTYIKFRRGKEAKLGGVFSEIVKPTLRRAWRILPMTLLVIALTMVLPLLGSGPNWNLMIVKTAEQCLNNWWTILYFGSNFVPFDQACSIQSWYVCVDVQLYVVFALFAYCYNRNRKVAFGSLIATGVVSTIWTTWETFFYGDPPTLIQYNYDIEKVNEYLGRAHQSPEWHVGVYSAGLALGSYLAQPRSWPISQGKKILGWAISVLMMCFVMFSSVRWNRGINPSQFETLLYVALCKPFIAIILSWTTFLCVTGNGGFLNEILSWKGFEWFSKFTFLVYLINLPVIFYYFASTGGLVDSYDNVLVGLAVQFAVVSGVLAFWLHVFFESPLIELEKAVFPRRKTKANKSAVDNNTTTATDVDKVPSTGKLVAENSPWKDDPPPKKITTVSRFT